MIAYIVIGIIGIFVGFLIGALFAMKISEKVMYQGRFERYQKQLFDSCMSENRNHKIALDGYFLRNNYKRIVVYGLGVYHEEFLKDISENLFDEIYLADRSARTLSGNNRRVYSITEVATQDFYDCIVVTSYNHAKEIEKELRELGVKKDIISYRDLVINATKENR